MGCGSGPSCLPGSGHGASSLRATPGAAALSRTGRCSAATRSSCASPRTPWPRVCARATTSGSTPTSPRPTGRGARLRAWRGDRRPAHRRRRQRNRHPRRRGVRGKHGLRTRRKSGIRAGQMDQNVVESMDCVQFVADGTPALPGKPQRPAGTRLSKRAGRPRSQGNPSRRQRPSLPVPASSLMIRSRVGAGPAA